MSTNCCAKQVSWKSTIILVIRLCILVKSAIQQSKRSHVDGLTLMESAANVIINNDTEMLPLDFNTRGWQNFDNWKSNEPQVIEYRKVAYSVKIGNQSQHHLLISRGYGFLRNSDKIPNIYEYWLYTENTNSWQRVNNGDFPRTSGDPVMVQLCSKIFAFDSDLFNGLYSSIKAWLFDTVLLNWKKTKLHGGIADWIVKYRIKVYHVTAFAVQQSQTNCQCNQSVIIMAFGNPLDINLKKTRTMSEVRCVSRQGQESYKWVPLKSNFSDTSNTQLMASIYSSLVLYDTVEKALRKFENDVWTTVSTLPVHLQPFRYFQRSNIFSCAVATNSSSYIVFSLRDRKVLHFDLKRNNFIIESVAGDIPDVWNDQIVSSIFEDQNIIIVFTINHRSSKTIVWKFNHESNVWFWKRLPGPDILPFSYDDSGSTYDITGNYLTLLTDFPETPTDTPSWSKIIWNLDLASMRWSLKVKTQFPTQNMYVASCWIDSCFVALSYYKEGIKTWIYNATDYKWRSISNSPMKVGYSMSFIAANETTAILFSDETWILQLKPVFQWRQAAKDIVQPSARFHPAAVMMQSKMYVFGGQNDSGKCLNDLWVFEVEVERWSELTTDNKRPNFLKASQCRYSAASTPGQLLITVGISGKKNRIYVFFQSRNMDVYCTHQNVAIGYIVASNPQYIRSRGCTTIEIFLLERISSRLQLYRQENQVFSSQMSSWIYFTQHIRQTVQFLQKRILQRNGIC